MGIRAIRSDEHADMLALVDAELRPAGATTRAVDDFPLALDPANRNGLYVCERDGCLVGCLTSLVWSVRSSLGDLSVAAIGSVVTAPDYRGQGISRRLQATVLEELRRRKVQLAILWSDRPDIYRGRGFRPAGVEYHVDLHGWRPVESAPDCRDVRAYLPDDAAEIAELYRRHPYRVVRGPDQSAVLYGMPGTRGLVWLNASGRPAAYAFCGKGADFPDYIAEWGGDRHGLDCLLTRIRSEKLARYALVPQGAESALERWLERGAVARPQPSGLWAVLDEASLLAQRSRFHPFTAPAGSDSVADPCRWLGNVLEDGSVQDGFCRLAIWGLDSI